MLKLYIFCAAALLLPQAGLWANSAASVKNVTYPKLDEQMRGQAIFSVVRDGDDFVWMASRSLIARFDGRRTIKYRLNSSEVITDNDGLETYLRFSTAGALWAFTDNGKVFRYDARGDRFKSFLPEGALDRSLRLTDIFFPSDNAMWLATSGGLYSVSESDDEKMPFVSRSYLEGLHINSISELSDGYYAVNTTNGAKLMSVSDGTLKQDTLIFEDCNILRGYFDAQSRLYWCGTFNSGLKCWDVAAEAEVTGPFSRTIPSSPVRAIEPFGGDKILLGLDGPGVYMLDRMSNVARQYISDGEFPGAALRGNGVYDIMSDGSKIWVATYTGGVAVVDTPSHFEMVAHIPFEPQSLLNDHVHSILEDRDGDMWYATASGVSVYLTRDRRWIHHIDDGNTYLTISEAPDGRVWCGGFNAGTHCIDKHRGVVKSILSLGGDKHTDCIYASMFDDRGHLWLGGIFNQLTCISSPGTAEEKRTFYDIMGVNSIVDLGNDSLLVNTANGFYILDRREGGFERYLNIPADMGVETSSFIYTGIEVGGKLWLGTSGGGLNLYDLAANSVENFSTKDGLPSNFIYAILKDRRQRLWISSGDGIFCFDPIHKRVLFNVSELPARDFVFMSACGLRNGTLAFGTSNGALIVNPANYKPAPRPVNLFFTGLRVSYNAVTAETDGSILSDYINNVPQVRLKHDQNSFSIDFGAVDVYHPADYSYSYRLEGFESEWSPKGDYDRADFTNIPSGRYRFSVRCFNKNSPEQMVEKQIDIIIAQPFWYSGWAWVVYLFLLATLAWLVRKYYSKKMESRRFDDKINFFVNVAHDIRTPLSLMMAPLNDLEQDQSLTKGQRYYLDLAIKNSNTLYGLVTRLLDFHKMETIAVKTEYRAVGLCSYLEQKVAEYLPTANKKKLEFELRLPENELFAQVDFDRLNHIVGNLISNSMKYTQDGGRIVVRLHQSGRRAVIEVEDNGMGIGKSDRSKIFRDFYRSRTAIDSGEVGSGIGLTLARRMARQMNGKLSFTSLESVGSTFRLTFPYIQAGSVEAAPPVQPDSGVETTLLEQERAEGQQRILLVEDNNDMRNYLAYSLSGDYKVYAVRSAEEALDFLQTGVVDIVISDVMLDGMSGIELCRRLKTKIETSHLFVILLTAAVHPQSVRKGFESGADDYITKPLNVDMLKMKLSNMLHTRKKIQQQYLASSLMSQSEPVREEDNVSSLDDDFLKKCITIVTDNVANANFMINDLCREVAMSRTVTYEKLRAMTGQSPSEFIRTIRLSRARELLLTGRYSIPEVSDMTGFSDPKYFSTVFKKYFGHSPSKITSQYHNEPTQG